MNKKMVITILITIIIELILNLLLSLIFSWSFIEIQFFLGVIFTFVIFLFSGSGGTFTRYMNSKLSAETGYVQRYEHSIFHFNGVFLGSLIYTAIGLVFLIYLVIKY
ncbi:hypothetical protein CKF48_23280 (plasmid) [Cytobacillus kochii]|uniref:Uncharacterized protein n=1 Tax=Cytobacillus kochii TaxID=859143 RepID=A0A248TQ10_9BACI|nr:hypothetical protein CKF48_23280 [Cytobacillus kochii]